MTRFDLMGAVVGGDQGGAFVYPKKRMAQYSKCRDFVRSLERDYWAMLCGWACHQGLVSWDDAAALVERHRGLVVR